MQRKPLKGLESLQTLLSEEEKQKVSKENENRDKQWKEAQDKIKQCSTNQNTNK